MPDKTSADEDNPTVPCRGCGKPIPRVKAKSQAFCVECRYKDRRVRGDKLTKRKHEEPLPAGENAPQFQPKNPERPQTSRGTVGKLSLADVAAEATKQEVREWLGAESITPEERELVLAYCFGGCTSLRELARTIGKGRTWVSTRLKQSVVKETIKKIRAHLEQSEDLPQLPPVALPNPPKAVPLNLCARNARRMLDPAHTEYTEAAKRQLIKELGGNGAGLAHYAPQLWLERRLWQPEELVNAIRRCPALLLDNECRPLLVMLVDLLEAMFFGLPRRSNETLLPGWYRPFKPPKRCKILNNTEADDAAAKASAIAEKLSEEARRILGIPPPSSEAEPKAEDQADCAPVLPEAPEMPRQHIASAAEKVVKALFKRCRGGRFHYPDIRFVLIELPIQATTTKFFFPILHPRAGYRSIH